MWKVCGSYLRRGLVAVRGTERHESQHHEHSQFFSQMSVCFDAMLIIFKFYNINNTLFNFKNLNSLFIWFIAKSWISRESPLLSCLYGSCLA